MSSNNNPRNQGSNSQGSKSPSQESSKPASGAPETAGQQKVQDLDAGKEKDANAQTKQGGMNQGQSAQPRSEGDDQKSEKSENAGNANAAKGTGTR